MVDTSLGGKPDFLEEVISFPAAPHDDQFDALCQGLAYLRGSGYDFEGLRSVGALQTAYDAQRHNAAVGYGQMINNVNDMLDYEDGPSAGGLRYTLPTRFSRTRGGW